MEQLKEILLSEEFLGILSAFLASVLGYLIKVIRTKSKLLDTVIEGVEEAEKGKNKSESTVKRTIETVALKNDTYQALHKEVKNKYPEVTV